MEKGEPCKARFLDKYENLHVCHMTRPLVISFYFDILIPLVFITNQDRLTSHWSRTGLQRISTLEFTLQY